MGEQMRETDERLRDQFAMTCDQPGVSEIVAMAGLVWSASQVWRPDDPDHPIGSFDKWWSSLPLADRFSLYARVRYAMADAMLAERAKALADGEKSNG